MELLEHDKENINELLHVITELAQYYSSHLDDYDDKSFQQPILFNKPKNSIEWTGSNLPKITKFDIIDLKDLKRDRGIFDTDIIWYNSYVLSHGHSLLFHKPLDWQLISISNGEITPENKIYVNTNRDSDLFGFYAYAPGSDDKELFGYHIIATNDEQFKTFWHLLRCIFGDKKEHEKEHEREHKKEYEHDGRDIPLKIIFSLVQKIPCLLDNFYVCSERECREKKKKICQALGINLDISKIRVVVKECGTCYWIRVETKNNIVIGGDLFYDRLQNKFVTRGRIDKFLKWENSFEKITKALNIDI
jgi:hypothetical protein